MALQPIVSLVGGFLFKERTTYSAIATMGIAILGVMCIGWGDLGLSKQAIYGDILSFLSVIAVVGYLFIGQTTVKKVSHWIYSFTVFAFAGLFMGIYNVILQVPFTGYTRWDWTVFLLLAIVPTVSHVINNWLLNYVNATTISMSILGEPVGASILAFFLLGEKLNAMQIIGSMLVLFGVSVFLLQQQNVQQKCRKRAGVYTGIIVLGEKRSCDTSLLFYKIRCRRGGKWNFHQKDVWLHPIFLL